MSTIFELIMAGAIPGRFIWSDDRCVAIMTIEPVSEGHSLVIPRTPIDKWTDLPAADLEHVMRVAQTVGIAQEQAFGVPRAAVVIAGFEVPHTHVHVIPAESEAEASLRNARSASDESLDRAAEKLRATLREQGHGDNVPN